MEPIEQELQQEVVRILVADDEEDILEILKYNLEKEGFEVYTAKNGIEALDQAKNVNPHLIILDIMMPEMDGIEACRELRMLPEFKHTLIVFLTARNEDYSQIAGFEVGADDYIAKPLKPRVLSSRLKAILRRAGDKDELEQIKVGNLVIDKEKYLVLQDDNPIKLPKKEFELLVLLTSKPDKVFRRNEILSKIWGGDVIVGDRTIDVHIRKLREKIGQKHLKTVKGVGYKFEL